MARLRNTAATVHRLPAVSILLSRWQSVGCAPGGGGARQGNKPVNFHLDVQIR